MPQQYNIKDAKSHESAHDRKVKELEEELSTTKYNKKTQGHIGLVKAKLAKIKEEYQRKAASKGKGEGFSVKRSGDATAIIVGFPSVGKSTLLNAITNANSPVGAYAFTTLTCIPGLMEYNHSKIQVLDVPGIVEGAATGRGRGKEVLACAQSADLVIILLDVFHPEHLEVVKREIFETGLRINQKPPQVKISKKARGGIDIGTTVKLTKINKETIMGILKEFRLDNSSIVVREDITDDQLIDVIEGNKKYIPSITVLNMIDMVSAKELERIKSITKPDICISAEKRISTEELKGLIFKKLDFIRIFCKEVGKKADVDVPLIMRKGNNLRNVCEKLHKDFISKFRFARVWGKSVKFDSMIIKNLEHRLEDRDIVEIHLS
ncbi:GTP-binding protein [Candidatus Woesearchaeota archaeon]|nr:GTP-binding protein [Candidatus Woesearchaeota archaeon]